MQIRKLNCVKTWDEAYILTLKHAIYIWHSATQGCSANLYCKGVPGRQGRAGAGGVRLAGWQGINLAGEQVAGRIGNDVLVRQQDGYFGRVAG